MVQRAMYIHTYYYIYIYRCTTGIATAYIGGIRDKKGLFTGSGATANEICFGIKIFIVQTLTNGKYRSQIKLGIYNEMENNLYSAVYGNRICIYFTVAVAVRDKYIQRIGITVYMSILHIYTGFSVEIYTDKFNLG